MVALDIQKFSESRTKARVYFCYLFSENIPNRLPSTSLNTVIASLLKIRSELSDGLSITISQPLYDGDGNLLYIACLDMLLVEVLKISKLNMTDAFFNTFFKYAYALFSIALLGISLMLFLKGTESFMKHGVMPSHFEIKDMFNSTILLTLSLAIFDLAKTLIEEEFTGRLKERDVSGPHKTMVRFLGSIIIALSIEALMLVFKFAITAPSELIYATYILAGVGMLIVSLAIYIKFTKLRIED